MVPAFSKLWGADTLHICTAPIRIAGLKGASASPLSMRIASLILTDSIQNNCMSRSRNRTFSGQLLILCALLTGISGCSSLPGSYKAQLANYLTETDAKMYGAYWCPHCAVQKQYFNGVVDLIPYVECDPQGYDPQPELCSDMGIDVYPTWIIKGEYYFGAQPLGKLAVLSGFESETEPPAAKAPVEPGGYSPAQ